MRLVDKHARWSALVSDPVLIIGTAVSAGLAIWFAALADQMAAVLGALTGLTGITMTLVLKLLGDAMSETQKTTRRDSLHSVIEQVPMLLDQVELIVEPVQKLHETFGHKSPAVSVCNYAFSEFISQLTNLRYGKVDMRPDDNRLWFVVTTGVQRTIRATSLQKVDMKRWHSSDWTQYWDLQVKAIKRGVHIQRIFIYDEWTNDLDSLARGQASTGVDVRRLDVKKLSSQYHIDMVVWDDSCGYHLRPTGDSFVNSFTLAQAEIQRMLELYEIILLGSEPVLSPKVLN